MRGLDPQTLLHLTIGPARSTKSEEPTMFRKQRKRQSGAALARWLGFGLACLLAACTAVAGDLTEVDGRSCCRRPGTCPML